jgi:hypothetical protein
MGKLSFLFPTASDKENEYLKRRHLASRRTWSSRPPSSPLRRCSSWVLCSCPGPVRREVCKRAPCSSSSRWCIRANTSCCRFCRRCSGRYPKIYNEECHEHRFEIITRYNLGLASVGNSLETVGSYTNNS